MVLHCQSCFFRLIFEDCFTDSQMFFIYELSINGIVVDRFDFKTQIMIQDQTGLSGKPSIMGSIRNKTMKLMINPVKKTTVKRGEILLYSDRQSMNCQLFLVRVPRSQQVCCCEIPEKFVPPEYLRHPVLLRGQLLLPFRGRN